MTTDERAAMIAEIRAIARLLDTDAGLLRVVRGQG